MSGKVGGVILTIAGVIIGIIGWQRLNSLSSEISDFFGSPDTMGIILLAGGIIAVIAGIVMISRSR